LSWASPQRLAAHRTNSQQVTFTDERQIEFRSGLHSMSRPAIVTGVASQRGGVVIRFKALLAVWLLGPGLAPLQAQAPFRVDTGVRVPMRDGVVLRADVFRPDAGGRHPVLVYRTPYNRDELPNGSPLVQAAVRRGYAVVLQDVRGRYQSGGTFEPYFQEGRDGYDTIEWAARQPWSDGRVGSFGLSYPGAVQWLAAVEGPPSLRAMVPAMTYSTPENFWTAGGVWDSSWLDWTWLNIAPDLRRRLGLAGPATDADAEAAWAREGTEARRFRPMLRLPQLQGVTPWYFEWMRHPPGDGWWDPVRLTGKYARAQVAVLNLSGWFDEMYGPSGAVENYTAAGDALILGPWTHGVGPVQSRKAGERDFGAAAALDWDGTVLAWMDRHVKGDSSGPSPRVRVFVMGADRWRSADGWPWPGVRSDTMYLGRRGGRTQGGGAARMGVLARRPPGGGETVIRSDPSRPVTDPYGGRFGAHDYRALRPAAGVAVFETAPFPAPLEIIGRVEIELAASASVPDFDLWVQLYDVAPDGTAWNLSTPGTAVRRASYRDGGPARKLVVPGETVRLRMDKLITANRFLKGHRLRAVITPAFSPVFSVNPQTGGLEFDSDSVRAGTIRIGHSAERASWIVLPTTPVSPEPEPPR
jgi:putative CocE/NonD family hydrolase